MRLDGNNVAEGRAILRAADHPLVTLAETMDGGADRAAELAHACACPRRDETETDMAIFLTEASKVIVQGMTGSEGTKHTTRMLAAGTQIVGGVNPRKAGTTQTFPLGDATVDVPVFGTVAEAMAATGADVSVVFVPPAFAKAAVLEAIEARHAAGRDHHRGHPGGRHRGVLHRRAGRGRAADRAELPRASSAPGSRTWASPRPTSPAPAGSGSCRKSGTLTYQMMYELRDLGLLHRRSASAATRSSGRRTSTRSRRSRRTRRPTRS